MEKIDSYQTRVSNLEQILDEVSNNSEKFDLDGELRPINFIKNKVSKLNDQEFKDVYLKFLEMFELFWKDIYSKLCVEEIKQIEEQSYQKSRCSFAFDYNEVLKSMLSNSRLFDKYYSMFRNLASLFSEEDIRIFFEKHLMLFSKLHFFEMNVETNKEYGNDVTYRFDIHSRTDRAYHAFIKMFDEERKAGKRNSPLINNDELKNYIKRSLSMYNSYINDLYPEKVVIEPVLLLQVNIEGVGYSFDINEVSFEYINNFINDPRLQERYRRYHEEFIGSVGDGCFGIYDEAFLDDDIYINLDLDNENNRRMDQCFGISSWVDPALFPIFGESLLYEYDIKLVQKGIVFVSRYYGKEGLSKIRGFGFGNVATNLPFYIGFDDLKDEYELGRTLLFDRYTTSSIIYQGASIEDIEKRKAFIDYVCDYEYNKLGIPEADNIIFLHAPFEVIEKQRNERKENEGISNDIHERNREFLKKVYDNAMFVADYLNWDMIDCSQDGKMLPIDEIHQKVYSKVKRNI